MKLDVFDLNNKKVREIEVNDALFGAEVKEHLLHEVVKAQLRFRRLGTAKVKGRSEVHGTTRKMYKQKGTGNARHGSRKAPLFPKGGIYGGPHGMLGVYKINKKVMKGGLISALSLTVKEKKFVVVDNFTLTTHKTKEFTKILSSFGVTKGLVINNYNEEQNDNLYLSARNVRDIKMIKVAGVNVFDILKYQTVLISEDSLRMLEERLSK